MSQDGRLAVLHAACGPVTGPWSVMRDVALAQAASGRYAGVGIAVIVDDTWPTAYREEIRNAPVTFYESRCPRLFGTASFLYQRVRPPDWAGWIRDLAARSGTTRVVVHLHNAWMSGAFLPLPEIPGIEVGVVATFHGVNEDFQGKPVRRALHRWMARRLVKFGATLTSVDGANTARAESLFGIPRAAFAVVPNGLAPCDAAGCPAARDAARLLTLAHVGSMIHQKGWHLLAEAAERLNRQRVQVRVLLAGQGPESEAAAAWAARHPEWAEYLGHVPNPRSTIMPRIDVLCLMSEWEGLPMSILEAMSVGLPVIATDVGGVSEAVGQGESGLLIPRTVDALVEAVEGLLLDRSRLASFQAGARRRFQERFTLDRVVALYEAVYQESLS